MLRSRPALRLAALVTLLLAGSFFAWSTIRPAMPGALTAVLAQEPSRLPLSRWEPGEERTYRFAWDDLQRVELPVPTGAEGSSLTGTLHLEGELTLQALEVRADGARLRLGLKHLDRHEAVVSGQALFPDDASVQAQLPASASAWLELDARGALLAARFSESEPPMFRQFAQTLAAELFPTELRDAPEWSAAESTQTGEVEAQFRFEGDDASRLTRRRTRYQSLRAAGKVDTFQQKLSSLTQFERDPEGHLAGVSLDEVLEATRTDGRPLVSRRMRLRVVFSSREQKPLLAAGEDKPIVRAPAQIAFEGDPEVALLRSQADGMTVDAVLEALASAGDPEAIPDLGGFARRAIAALKLEPERAGELALAFRRKDARPALRELMLDLLVGAGHAQAQATLRELIQSPEAREHAAAHALMVQRAGFLEHPEPETGRMLVELRAQARTSADAGLERASSYALGAVVSHLPPDAPEVPEYLRVLEDSLARADSAEERLHALRALGNTGAEHALELTSPHLRDAEADVRAAAAEALRRSPQEVATRMLLDALEQERERAVQSALLDALDGRTLGLPELERLRGWLVAGRLAPGAESTLLNVLSHRLDGSAPVVQMLQVLSLRPGQQPATRARVLALMAQASARRDG
ncbi:HEAT repeat domain-containing protein [Pyxidicoccus parkwayensis]|uniref:HEAT repeat domain-containing protein n=1 Tax=Pyxidicoccus parkwayensis TaxID=2813578 RepID=A0ABX7P0B4_9BACT|nr:HEAT repeat domain-containing protein [Pyxidicoccus parkwaysis]QSQ24612.1 HEAT repeat domain-containing protein [Pyxidicoccus parkwaysis]